MDSEINKHVLKTGTLTLGLVCKDGIVIAADKRQSYGAQGGGVVYVSGNADKIQRVNEQMIATTAGTASDSRKVLTLLSAELRLKELRTRSKITVSEAAHFLSNMVFQNIRTPSMIPSIAHFLLSGYDDTGIKLYDISPDGYIQEIDTYAATGSGFMQAHPILDSEYKKGISVEEGIRLAAKCIKASMGREPSVGGGIDIYTVRKGEVKPVLAQEASYEFKNRN